MRTKRGRAQEPKVNEHKIEIVNLNKAVKAFAKTAEWLVPHHYVFPVCKHEYRMSNVLIVLLVCVINTLRADRSNALSTERPRTPLTVKSLRSPD